MDVADLRSLKKLLPIRENAARTIQFYGFEVSRIRREQSSRTHSMIESQSCLAKIHDCDQKLKEALGPEFVPTYTGDGNHLAFVVRSNVSIRKKINQLIGDLDSTEAASP